MLLYRPVGLEELGLIYQADMRAFPPPLPDQPVFRALLSRAYAEKMARVWNTEKSIKAGFVTRFEIEDAHVSRLVPTVVGLRESEELCVPTEDLGEFNRNIAGAIQVVLAFFGEGYQGYPRNGVGVLGKNADQQFLALAASVGDSGFYLVSDLTPDGISLFLNFFYWEQRDFSSHGISRGHRDRVLEDLRRVWSTGKQAALPLGIATGSPNPSKSC
jgi:hypothetical protein